MLRPEPTQLDNWNPINSDSYPLQEIAEFSLNEIFNGSETHLGLIPMLLEYLNTLHLPEDDLLFYKEMFGFLGMRAKGELKTDAHYLRDLALAHPDYK